MNVWALMSAARSLARNATIGLMLAGSYLSKPVSGLVNLGFTSVIGVRARGAMQLTVTL